MCENETDAPSAVNKLRATRFSEPRSATSQHSELPSFIERLRNPVLIGGRGGSILRECNSCEKETKNQC